MTMLAAMAADQQTPALDLSMDPADLTAALVDIESVSDHETPIADAVEAALRAQPRRAGIPLRLSKPLVRPTLIFGNRRHWGRWQISVRLSPRSRPQVAVD